MSWSAIWGNLKDFGLYLPVSLWFNFRHLPFKQACRLPILIGASRISTCRGRVRIESDRIRPGMIRLGRKCTGIFPRQRFLWENRGSVVFKGECMIGSNSSVCVGEKGTLILGENFAASASLKLICYHHVSFGTNTLIGWDCIFCDTDFHRTKSVADGAGPAATAHASFGNRQRPGKRTCPAVAVNGHEREKEIIVWRYGLDGKKPMTQKKVGEKLGISRSYVSRIEKRALEKLKKALDNSYRM